MMFTAYLTLFLLGLVDLTEAYNMFRERIPNGDKVPHPCIANHIWKGVGHKNRFGGGDRNPFGIDFKAQGYAWNTKLCEKDSDGDGKTNGEELGDPNCSWFPGQIPEFTERDLLSHPGVCEPVGSDMCKSVNNWDFCDLKGFECPSINSSDVKNLTLKLDKTPVPAKDTTYICQVFDLDATKDYHIIADQPELDNENVIHHAILYGCADDPEGHLDQYKTPQECGMQAQGLCGSFVALWAVGDVGTCYENLPAGIRIGKTAFKRLLLELHWTNPLELGDWQDGSGMTIYYTEQLRPNDLANLIIGQVGLRIPGGETSVVQEGVCPGSCTREQLNNTIHIASANVHMHYLGQGGYVDHYRNGSFFTSLAADDDYSYDSPKIFSFDPPVQFQPGDELRIRCDFKSTSNKLATYYGDATSDEMCFAFLLYYPANPNFLSCTQIADHLSCGPNFNPVFGECDISIEDDPVRDAVFEALYSSCDITGNTCHDACAKLLTESDAHPCLKNPAKIFYEQFLPAIGQLGTELKNAFRSCDVRIYDEGYTAENGEEEEEENKEEEETGGVKTVCSSLVVVFMSGVISLFHSV